jgi:hypothetical protein
VAGHTDGIVSAGVTILRRLAGASCVALAVAAAAACADGDTPPPAQAAATPAPRAVFPLHVEPGKRYLVDAAGQPFFMNGDSPWLLMVEPTREEVETYLEDRRRKGFNALLVELIEHMHATNTPSNIYGDAPFTTPGDFTTPNERYFAHADFVLRKAAEKGMLVLLTPAYVGYEGSAQGWYQEMVANGADKLRAYGRFLGARYRNFDNILWVDGGDYKVPDKGLVRALAEGIRSADSKPHTYHASRRTAALQFWGTDEPWLNVDTIYTDENGVVDAAFGEVARSSAPFFLIEARYEGDRGAGAQVVRRQAYQAVLSGASGHVMGNLPLWKFARGWRAAMDSPASLSVARVGTFFTSRAWWTLEPDVAGALLTGGTGAGGDRAAAARERDGSSAIVYMPSARDVTLDLARLAGPRVKARWIDPASGAASDAADAPLAAAGRHTFRPPPCVRPRFHDWLLVLDAVP